jgi:hypothetical protein
VEDQYKDKNIDLLLLSKRISRFFNEIGFKVSMQKKEGGCVIFATPEPSHGITDKIEVDIHGGPDDFSVRFSSGSRSNDLVRYGRWASLIIGGYFLLKGLRSQEEIEKLEKKFWVYVDETVWYLSERK